MVKIESKEKLAKLLAMEDLDVQHKQVPTAYFDVKNRTLVLPTWKDMPNHLYDLLVGHEVGHALFTPTSEKQLKTLIEKTSKHCVNIVEDARIENLVKRKYPGLRKQFFKGYTDLVEKNFFGIDTIDPNTMKFLDKINMHFKIPTFVNIDFTDEQEVFIERIDNAKSFKDVSDICIDLAEYIKENPEIDPESDTDDHQEYQENEDDENSIGEENSENDSESSEKNEESSDDKNEEGSDESSSDNESEGESDDVENDEENNSNQGSPETGKSEPSSPTAEDNLEDGLKSETYDNFENNVNDLVEKDTNNIYLSVPEKINPKSIVDYKKVHSNIAHFYKRENFNALNDSYSNYDDEQFSIFKTRIYNDAKLTLSKIKKDSVKNVNHMAMDFERKKCADIYKRTLITKTGVLDTNKLFSAKYNEDVFKKNVKSPEGKNHGLVLFVDWSGSMSYNLEGCIKQLIELVLFCKKVNIPFEVYSFTDIQSRGDDGRGINKSFKFNHDDIVIDSDVRLRNYLSSRMSTAELNQALINVCIISNAYARMTSGYGIPVEDRLGYTPLCGAILFSEHVIRDFKNKNNVQEVHSVWITDGEGNQSYNKWDVTKNEGKGIQVPAHPKDSKWDSKFKYYLQDKKTKKNHLLNYGRVTDVCFQIVKDRLGINVVGFFIDLQFGSKNTMETHFRPIWDNTKPAGSNWDDYRIAFKDFAKETKKAGYLIKTQRGYDEYYVISSSVKEKKQVELTEKMTARKMASLFSSQSTQFKNSRILLSRFIDLITVNS
tara:strand:+ start:1618 stop:3939 length:2322 start_codon:yes stop_codon:yes gene_type:complete